MYLPNLDGLNLVDNCIVSIKPLRRMILSSNLYVISLDDNFITNFVPLIEMPHQKILREIGINFMI